MKTIKTSELTGAALDWAVAKCEGRKPSHYKETIRATRHPDFPDSPPMFGHELNYSTDWEQGGPIIEREKIGVDYFDVGNGRPVWIASKAPKQESGPTPLISAMRCYVSSKLGYTVEVPDELAF